MRGEGHLTSVLRLLLVALVSTGLAQDYDYDYDTDYDYANYHFTDEPPVFTASPHNFVVEVGDHVTFPCDVPNLGFEALHFLHINSYGEEKLLFVGGIKLTPSTRLRKKGNRFALSGVERSDAGKYVCRVEALSDVVQIAHSLDVQYPATIRRVSEAVQRVTEGSSVTLECQAEGNPPPTVSWRRVEGRLPSGTQSEEGVSLTLHKVDRNSEGTYLCSSSNDIGEPASASMTVEVEFPPEIITSQDIVHSREGNAVQLTCIVHGRPAPQVFWSKGGRPVEADNHLIERESLERHSLTIRHLQENDLGRYECTAANALGPRQESFQVTGLAKTPQFTSSPAGGEESYSLSWETESYSPITRYRLQYRMTKANATSQHPSNWQLQIVRAEEASVDNSWPLVLMTHLLARLEPDTDYEAKVAVENKFGWSQDSEVFLFYTDKENPSTAMPSTVLAPVVDEALIEEAVVGQSTSGGRKTFVSLVLMAPVIVLGLL